jgi:hypothetical protein
MLSRTPLSQLDCQLSEAGGRYAACMAAASGGDGAGPPKPAAASCNTITGLATGTFGARLKNGVITSQGIINGKSDLSAADKAALARLSAGGRYTPQA